MALTSAQLADLVAKAKVILGIEDDDEAYHADGIAVFGASPLTTATVQVTATTVVLVDDVVPTTTLTLADAANDTLGELATVISAVANWTATLLGKSDVDSALLVRRAATSCLGQANEVVLAYENQEKLELLITNTFASIETYLRRTLLTASFTEVVDLPQTSGLVVLDEPDVTQVSGVFADFQSGLTCTYTGNDTNARVEVTDTAVVLTSRAGATTTTTTTLYSAQATTTAMASTINGVAGWTGTVVTDGPSAYLVRQGVRDAKNVTVTLEAWVDYDGDFETDYSGGVVEFYEPLSSARGRVRVDYVAGLASIPSDLEGVILSGVKSGWDSTSKDSAVQSEKLGDYSYALGAGGSAAAAAGGLSDEWFATNAGVLSKYARVRP